MNDEKSERFLYLVMSIFLFALFVGAFAFPGTSQIGPGLYSIQVHPGRLISDYTSIGGSAATLINGALVGAIGLLLTWLADVKLSGPTVAAVLTMTGFGFFGKTPINIAPIILGVFLLCRLIHKPMKTYLLIALYGTALGPLVSFLAFEAGFEGFSALAASLIIGTITGLLLPPVAISMLKLHQGYNLYNLGLTCGFVGLFLASMIKGWGGDMTIRVVWNSSDNAPLALVLLISSLFFLLCGIAFNKNKLGGELSILNAESGRLPTDFMDIASAPSVLVNMGIMGLVSWLYILMVGGDFNGPTLGGAYTIIGFASFGKHLRNSLPVMGGVLIGCFLFGYCPSEPGPILAALFVTTLAPLAGDFGPIIGLIAGFIHLAMVMQTAAWHGGVDLYNNGFAGGLTATFLVALIEWYKAHKDEFEVKK